MFWVDSHTTISIELTDLGSFRLGSITLRFHHGNGKEAKALGRVGLDTYRFLRKKLHLTPAFELVMLSEADWKEAFGSQPYGDPVTPGDGRVYYGAVIPDSWKEVVGRALATNHSTQTRILTPPFFRRTIAHEIGHLFSNELMSSSVRERMDEDFSAGKLEILWFVETFSQLCQFTYLAETKDSQRLRWLRLYRRIFDSFRPIVRYPQLTEWGTHVVRRMQADPENARLNYMFLQAKSYLMCAELNQEVGSEALLSLARVIKVMEYPIVSNTLLKNLEIRAPWFRDAFNRWNTI